VFARGARDRTLTLGTNDILVAARSIDLDAGFRLIRAPPSLPSAWTLSADLVSLASDAARRPGA
jgi:hypothetical protein